MKNITMIAAVGKNLELGKDNDLIWHFKEDMKFFKENTINKPIVMGMKTLESLPHLLPKRTHIVLTRQNKKLDNGIIIVHSVDELLDYIKRYDDEVMIIGGASVYKEIILSSIPEISLVFFGTILGSNSPFLSLGVSNSKEPNSLFKFFLVVPFL